MTLKTDKYVIIAKYVDDDKVKFNISDNLWRFSKNLTDARIYDTKEHAQKVIDRFAESSKQCIRQNFQNKEKSIELQIVKLNFQTIFNQKLI